MVTAMSPEEESPRRRPRRRPPSQMGAPSTPSAPTGGRTRPKAPSKAPSTPPGISEGVEEGRETPRERAPSKAPSTPGLAEALSGPPEKARPGCKWRSVVGELDDDVRVVAVRAAGDPKWADEVLARTLTTHGHPISAQVVRRHRRGLCSCP